MNPKEFRPDDFNWKAYVDDCKPNQFMSFVGCVKKIYQLTGHAPIGAAPPSPKAKEWLDEFLAKMQMKKDAKAFL